MIRAAIISLLLATPATALTEDTVVTPEQGARMVGQTVTLEMSASGREGVSNAVGGLLARSRQRGAEQERWFAQVRRPLMNPLRDEQD